jgi:hypothetical protein
LCAIDFAGEEERQTALARTLLRVVRVRRVVVASDQRVDDQVLVFTEDARQAGPVPGGSARRLRPAGEALALTDSSTAVAIGARNAYPRPATLVMSFGRAPLPAS